MEHGLSQTTARAFLQDRTGFMWIGTQDGLNRYDGYTFRVYLPNPDDPHSLAANGVSALMQDSAGAIWVGTIAGLSRYDPESDLFESFYRDPNNRASLSNDGVIALHQDRRGLIWIGTLGGLTTFDPATNTFRRRGETSDDPIRGMGQEIRHISESDDGTLWFATNHGLGRYSPDEDRFRLYDREQLPRENVSSLALAEDGRLWIGTDGGGLGLLDPQTDHLTVYTNDPSDTTSLASNEVSSVLVDRQGRVWAGTELDGVSLFNPSTQAFQTFAHDMDVPGSLSDDRVAALYEDASGGLWVGTLSGGANIHHPYRFVFTSHLADPAESVNSGANYVRSFLRMEDGTVWVGSQGGGITVQDDQGNVLKRYRNNPDDPSTLADNAVYSIFRSSDGRIWVGTSGGWVHRYDPATDGFQRIRADTSEASVLNTRAVVEDGRGGMWAGVQGGGVVELSPETGEVLARYGTNPNDPDALESNRIYDMIPDGDEGLWIATYEGGLNWMDLDTRTFVAYQQNPNDPTSISSDNVLYLYTDSRSRLWAGTSGGGLNLLDREASTFHRIDRSDGLPNNMVYGILEDSEGHFWLSTNMGLTRYIHETGDIRSFDVVDGLQSREFNGGAAYEDDDGTMFFGGIAGYNVFHPDSILDDPNPPKIALTNFLLFNREVRPSADASQKSPLKKAITVAEEVILTHRDYVLSFEFAALSFVNPEMNQYAYRMDGLEDEWNYVNDRRFVTYTTLAPGKYTFRVKAAGSNGIWNEEGVSLAVTVLPPFWATWWFRVGLLALVGAITATILRYRIRAVEAHNALLEVEVARRTDQLAQVNQALEKEMSEREQMEVELRHAQKLEAVGQLAAGIAHEINTPMQFIGDSVGFLKDAFEDLMTFAQTMKGLALAPPSLGEGETLEEKVAQAEAEADLDFIQEELPGAITETLGGVERVAQIVAAMKAFAHPGDPEAAPADLNGAIHNTLAVARNEYRPYAEVELDLLEDMPMVTCHLGDLNQVFLNLIVNAAHAIADSGKRGLIRVSTSIDGDDAVVAISDDGGGIPPHVQDRIFDPFFTTKEVGRGSGQGLAIAHSIVTENHHGKLYFETSPGDGTTFYVRLPVRGTGASSTQVILEQTVPEVSTGA